MKRGTSIKFLGLGATILAVNWLVEGGRPAGANGEPDGGPSETVAGPAPDTRGASPGSAEAAASGSRAAVVDCRGQSPLLLPDSLRAGAAVGTPSRDVTAPAYGAWLRSLGEVQGVDPGSSTADNQGELAAFLSEAAVRAGASLRLAVHSSAPASVRLEVLRIGASAMGARRVCEGVIPAGPQPAEEVRTIAGHEYTSYATWSPEIEVRSPDDGSWPSGLYELRLTTPSGRSKLVPFIVEDPDAPAQICYVAPYLTKPVAYNRGLLNRASSRSLYTGFAGGTGGPGNRRYDSGMKASAVAVQRPLENRRGHFYSTYVHPLARFLERRGYPVRYTSDLALARDPSALAGCSVLALAFHPEYVPAAARDAIASAVERGVHLLSFLANGFYWKVDLLKDASGHDVMIVDKNDASQRWRNRRDASGLQLSEQALFHAQYPEDHGGGWGGAFAPFVVEPRSSAAAPASRDMMKHWIFAGTGLKFGQRIPELFGGEIDTLHGPGHPVPQVRDQVVFLSPYRNHRGFEFQCHTSYFERPNGQMTFHTGSHVFQKVLDDSDDPGSLAVQRLVANIVDRMVAPVPPGASSYVPPAAGGRIGLASSGPGGVREGS